MNTDFNEAVNISVEVQALNLDGIKQNLLNYVQKEAKTDIADSVDKADKSAQSAETYAGEAAVSATTASACAEQTSENLSLYYKKNETDTLLNAKANVATTLAGYGITDGANTALSNLSADGQMIIDSQNGTISNCVLEIPQNIKLTLNNGVLTLKAGSIITLTGSTYTTTTTTEDISVTITYDGARLVLFNTSVGRMTQWLLSQVYSGATAPSTPGVHYPMWFDTTNKVIKTSSDYGETWTEQTYSYPLCIVNVSGGVTTSFAKDSNGNDMIFNGAGFIGHHAFVYPNVKALIPDGLNDDGSLKSSSRTQNALIIKEIASGSRTWMWIGYNLYSALNYYEVSTYKDIIPSAWAYYYVKDENRLYSANGSSVINENPTVAFFKVTYDGTTVTDFTIRQPYQGARNLLTDDLYKQIGDVETLLATV